MTVCDVCRMPKDRPNRLACCVEQLVMPYAVARAYADPPASPSWSANSQRFWAEIAQLAEAAEKQKEMA